MRRKEGDVTDEEILALETRFWLEGVNAYEAHLDEAALMAFPQMGVMDAASVVESLRDAPRWAAVDIDDWMVARPAEGLLVLGYRASARRGTGGPYEAVCTSTYHRDGTTWKLVQHQQSPV